MLYVSMILSACTNQEKKYFALRAYINYLLTEYIDSYPQDMVTIATKALEEYLRQENPAST